MQMSDDPRSSITKGFDYASEEHFSLHVECLKRGVEYRWLVYCWDDEEHAAVTCDWTDYLSKVPETCHPQIQSRMLLIEGAARLPYRTTLVGRDVCVVTPEPSRGSYGKAGEANQAIPTSARDLRDQFDRLWDASPALDAAESALDRSRTSAQTALHASLKYTILQILVDSHPQFLQQAQHYVLRSLHRLNLRVEVLTVALVMLAALAFWFRPH